MDGKTLLRLTDELLNESPDTSLFTSDRVGYEFLWQAATEFVNRTNSLKSVQSITTDTDQAEYTLNADYIELYQKNSRGKLFLKYTDSSSNDNFMVQDEENVIALDINSASVSLPGRFYVIDEEDTTDIRTATATTPTGAQANGETVLTASAATFETWDIQPGDTIHNADTGSSGYVIEISSETALVAALFGGTDQKFTVDDVITIVQQPRMKLVIHQPPSTADETITLPYIQRPAPVFSDFRRYRIQDQYMPAITKYAAWLYKYRDRKMEEGDAWYVYWDRNVRQAGNKLNAGLQRKGFSVRFMK